MTEELPRAYTFRLRKRRDRYSRFITCHVTISSPDIPKEFDGYCFAQLSDFHYGPLNPSDFIEDALLLVRDENPDLVILTGDYVQFGRVGIRHALATQVNPQRFHWLSYRRNVRQLVEEFDALLTKLSPPDGFVGVFGNHEHLEGVGSIRRLLSSRVTWLHNASTAVRRGDATFWISGIDDLKRGSPDIEQACSQIATLRASQAKNTQPGTHTSRPESTDAPARDTAFFRLFLSHNPDIILHPANHLLGDYQLLLCGHTHGGQIRVPLVGPILTRTRQRRHVWGLRPRKDSETQVYVTSGIGYGAVRVRLFCPPEVTIFRFEKLRANS